MAYVGNLTCRDCGLTFTSRWGPSRGIDEYRCVEDHVVQVNAEAGRTLAVDGVATGGVSLEDLRGRCPACGTELATGLLPRCPVCGSRDHDVLVEGTLS